MRDTLEANNELRELTNSEMDAVAGGLNSLGSTAQKYGGQVLGQIIQGEVGAYGGQTAAHDTVVPHAQTQV